MALINKIREKSGFAIGAIALGMLIFIVLGDLLGSQSRFFGGRDTTVGTIAGQDIDYKEFEAAYEKAKQGFAAQQGHQPNDQESASLRDQTWNQLVNQRMLDAQFGKVGLAVTEKELVDMVQGQNVHPSIKQSFTDPKTQQFDKGKVIEYLKNISKAPAEQQAAWTQFEQSLGPDRMRLKYENLLKLSTYVTKAEVARMQREQKEAATAKVLFVPYFTVTDSLVTVTDAQLTEYLTKHRDQFKVEDGRTVEYITIPVNPSKEDSVAANQEVAQLATSFASTTNDSLFVKANSDQPYTGTYVSLADLPQELRTVGPLEVGKVYGPFKQGANLQLVKVTGKKNGTSPAVRASHILFKANAQTPEGEADAKKRAEEVLAKIKGGADFAEMAKQYGTDGTAPQGGDLGYFTKGRMVPEFENAIFGAKSTGLIPTLVKTQFGYHIVKVTSMPDATTYQLATVQKGINASDNTHEMAYGRAQQFRASANDKAAFEAALAKDKTLAKLEAKDMQSAQRSVNNLPNARELVRWAYNEDTKLGAVSDVMEIDNQFVVAVLTAKHEKGYAKLDDVRERVTAEVRKELKGRMISEKLLTAQGATLEDIAGKYGPVAQVKTADNVLFANGSLPEVGYEPKAVGMLFGMKPGKRSAPIAGEQGVLILELTAMKDNPNPAPQDEKALRTQLAQQRQSREQSNLYQVLRDRADVSDSRVKFF